MKTKNFLIRFGRTLFLVLFTVAGVLCSHSRAFPQRYYIDITSPYMKKLPIAIPEFKAIRAPGRNLKTGDFYRLKKELPELLTKDLQFCGLFKVLNPGGFLVNPQKSGLTTKQINFKNWRIQGAELLVTGGYGLRGDTLVLQLRLFDVIKSRMILGRAFESPLDHRRHVIHKFAEQIYQKLTGKPGIFMSRIAFVNKNGKTKEIYVADFDGENVRAITKRHSISLSPKWSPDGKKLAFVTYDSLGPVLTLLDLSLGTKSRLSNYRGLNIAPAWNPQGKYLALTLTIQGNPEIYLINMKGKIVKRLTNFWGIDVSGSWSPDGKHLAYVSNSGGSPQIYILNVDTLEKRRITFKGNYNTEPAWSPKGDRIVYSSLSKEGIDIYSIRPDGTDLRQLTSGSGKNEHPSWSPDARMIVFSSTRTGQQKLWVMFSDGSGQRQLTFIAGAQSEPSWSPAVLYQDKIK